MTEASYFYSYFSGCGRELLALELRDPDPFSLASSEIVERVLAAGCTPDLDRAWRKPFPMAARVLIVRRKGQTFIVSIDTDAETITVQEQRVEAYEREG